MHFPALGALAKGASFRLRPYRLSDFPAVQTVVHSLGEGVLGWGLRHWEEAYEQQLGPSWTAEIEREPVGFASTQDYGNGVMIFHSDLVLPQWQRHGVGTSLALLRLSTLDPAKIVAVALLATQHSMPFYRRLGFESQGDPTTDPVLKIRLYQMARPFSAEVSDEAHELLRTKGVDFRLEEDEQISEQFGAENA